jgi:hypothetical protein
MQGMGSSRRGRGARRGVVVAALAAAAVLALPAVASANVPFQRITSPGPISDIYLGNELSCQVKLTQDEVYSYYPPAVAPGDCGTFLQINGVSSDVYSPDFGAHDGSAASNADWVPWTPVSQTSVGGAGTQTDPYNVTTTTAAGATDFQVRERYEYVTGSRGYDVFITVVNNSGVSRTVDLYHAVDCYLAGSDFGYGFFDAATGGIFCTETPNNSPPGRLLGFTPGSSANHTETFYDTVWQQTDGTAYPNTQEPDVNQDNGIGLHFALTVPAGARAEVPVSLRGTVDSGDALETAITSGPKKKIKTKKKKAKATFQFSASLGGLPITNATFQCTVDNRAPVPCASPFTTKTKKGKHTFSVVAAANGETDGTPAAQAWKVKRKKKKK